MSKSSPSPPPPPDYNSMINTQGQVNQQAMINAAALNRVNQHTPYGNLTYTQTGTDANGIPQYSADQTLNPQDQQALDELRRQVAQRQGMAGSILNSLGTPNQIDFSRVHPMYDRNGANTNYQGAAAGWNAYGPQPGQAAPAQATPPAPVPTNMPSSSPANGQALAYAKLLRGA